MEMADTEEDERMMKRRDTIGNALSTDEVEMVEEEGEGGEQDEEDRSEEESGSNSVYAMLERAEPLPVNNNLSSGSLSWAGQEPGPGLSGQEPGPGWNDTILATGLIISNISHPLQNHSENLSGIIVVCSELYTC